VTLDLFLSIVAVAVLGAAMVRVPWNRFRTAAFQHLFLGACVAMLFLWRVRFGIVPGLPIHLLCLTTLTLMFGVPLAISAGAVLAGAMCVMGFVAWTTWSGYLLAFGVVPVVVTWLTLITSRRFLPPNLFIYIFVCAFFGAAASMLAAMVANSVFLLGSGQIAFSQIRETYLSIAPLMMFPEAFVNGFIVTVFVVFKPAWISSFDDEVYLKG
jgi:uncharacterized membrane protein